MGDAKRLIVRPISPQDANRIVRAIHYSGKVVNNSQVHLGIFLDGKCGGAMQFGPSLDKRRMMGLVTGTGWNEFLELNRLALADWLPRNSESRALSIALRFIRKTYPHIKWIVSFADATQCGDGAIYRASGFVLTSIKRNTQVWEAPDGERFSRMSLTDGRSKRQQRQAVCISRGNATKGGNILETGGASMKTFVEAGFKPLDGFQLRYVYFIDPQARKRLTCPILPFSEIDRLNARMYRGKRATSETIDTATNHVAEGGEAPTVALQ